MSPEPPPITITDPNAPPPGPADLLDTGPDRWRPSAYQKALALLTAAIVALISGGVAAVRHIDHQRALDRASVRAVTVYASIDVAPVDPSHEMAEPALLLSVANLGRDTVQLVRVWLDGTPLTLPDGGLVLAAGATFSQPLQPGRCTVRAGRTRTREVTVDLRTRRGQEVAHRIVLEGAQISESNLRDRVACRTQLPEEAFAAGLLSVTRHGAVVTARLSVADYSMLPMTLRRVHGLPGLRLVARGVPVLLPAQQDPRHVAAPATITLTLRATDCRAFARYIESAADEPALPVDLHGALEDGVGRIPLFLTGEGGAGTDLLSRIAGACPNLYTEGPAH